MISIWAKSYTALVLVALSAPSLAAGPAADVRTIAGRQAPVTNPIERTGFALAAGPAASAPLAHGVDGSAAQARAEAVRSAQFGDGEIVYIEGPSWSYRTSRRGPVIEMGALGGGAMEDSPFLAHVALAWKF